MSFLIILFYLKYQTLARNFSMIKKKCSIILMGGKRMKKQKENRSKNSRQNSQKRQNARKEEQNNKNCD